MVKSHKLFSFISIKHKFEFSTSLTCEKRAGFGENLKKLFVDISHRRSQTDMTKRPFMFGWCQLSRNAHSEEHLLDHILYCSTIHLDVNKITVFAEEVYSVL